MRNRDKPIKCGNAFIYPHHSMSDEEWENYSEMLDDSKKLFGEEETKEMIIKSKQEV